MPSFEGTCSVCLLVLSITKTGIIRIHNRCAGSGLTPSQIAPLTASQHILERGPQSPGIVVDSDDEIENAALSSPFPKRTPEY